MSPDPQDGGGFTLDQLMELAGLAVAQAVAIHYPPPPTPISSFCAVPVTMEVTDSSPHVTFATLGTSESPSVPPRYPDPTTSTPA